MRQLPEGTVTFVFTDIEGSTRLLRTLGDRYRQALEQHRALLRDAFTSHAGVEVDTQGDAFFVAFTTPRGALQAAVRGQRALAEHPWPQGGELRVRMGLHTGTPEITREGYVGSDIHLGARICAAAWGGQILLSPTTAAHVFTTSDDIRLRSLGSHALKDIDESVELYQVVAPELRQDFPPPRTYGSHPTNLPPRLEPLIGRDADIATVIQLLGREDVTLVTLVGPGGTGKTRLALATGAELLSSFPDGVFFVDLSVLTDPSLVVPQIAQTLSLRETPGRSLQDTLTDHLSAKHTLLILDNLEQVIDAAPHIATLLTEAPDLKVLATSRESLRITGEKELPLAPLSLPRTSDPPEEITASPAVRLFVARAQGVRPDFTLTPDDASTVAEVCRRLDGLPLAIELAAARVKVLSLSALNERLEQGLRVLSSGRRDASERQRTLRGAIAWSYDLLSQDEQRLFRRLGVFAGGWSLEAAEAVCDQGDLGLEVLDGLASLVDKSLVRTDDRRERFSMLETIREFAAGRLDESGEAEDIRRAHAEFFCRHVEEVEPHLIGPDQKTWFDRLETEHDNIRAALGWALEHVPETAARTANALWRFWDIRGYAAEGSRWLDRILTETELSHPHRMRATQVAALLAEARDDYQSSISYGQEALSLARELDSMPDVARALITLGWNCLRQGNLEGASSAIEEAVALSEGFDDLNLSARALRNLGAVRSEQQRNGEAISLYKRSAEIAERLGDRRGVMMVLLNVGELALFADDVDEARNTLARVLTFAQEFNDPFHEAAALINLGIADLLGGEPTGGISAFRRAIYVARNIGSEYLTLAAVDGLAAALADRAPAGAARLFAASDALRARTGLPRSWGEQALYQPRIDALKGTLTQGEESEIPGEMQDITDVMSMAKDLLDAGNLEGIED